MTVAWDFGDGNTATEALDSPVRHTYTTPGDHTVTAEVESGEQLAKPITAGFRNLLRSDNHASAESGLDDWSTPGVGSVTVTSSVDRALHGTRSVRIQSTQSNAGWDNPFGNGVIELGNVGGRIVTFMCGLFLEPGWWPDGTTMRVRRGFLRETGSSISSGPDYFDTAVVGEWTEQRLAWTCPAGTYRVEVEQFYISGGGLSGKRCYLDRLGLFVGDVPWEAWSLPSEVQP